MAFKMRSGNKISFKMMGSSPAKQSAYAREKKAQIQNASDRIDLEDKQYEAGVRQGKRARKQQINAITGTPLFEKEEEAKEAKTKVNINQKSKPLKQKGPVDEKNPDLFEGEMEGTWVYEGSDLQERIIDLEERISFLVENDIPDAETEKEKKKYESAVKKLEQELAILQRERKQKEK